MRINKCSSSARLLLAAAAVVSGMAIDASASVAPAQAQNVILMISDGAGFNTWTAASMFEGKVGNQPYEQAGWVKMPMTTFPMNLSSSPTGNHNQLVSYDPTLAWNNTPISGQYPYDPTKYSSGRRYENYFAGYDNLRNNYTDSAAAGTALSSGIKTYNNSINWDNANYSLRSIYEIAKDMGKSTGTVSTVQWSHATPAAFGAHNISRNNYQAIAYEMLNSGKLDLIMGAGNPGFDNNGKSITPTEYKYVGGSTEWNALKAGTHSSGWKLIQSKTEFEALASGTLSMDGKTRLIGTAEVATTLQQSRFDSRGTASASPYNNDPVVLPGQTTIDGTRVALNTNVPTLATMATGALKYLAQNPNGFFVQIEGGAVDWAAHANETGRLIEEQMDFNAAVSGVINFVNMEGDALDWNNTLLVVTTDHGNGLNFGPDSDVNAFSKIVNNGTGALPGMKWHTGDHTNELVPMFAYGAGAELFYELGKGFDNQYKAVYGLDGSIVGYTDGWGLLGDNSFIDNTDVFYVMNSAMTGAPLPEPAALSVLVLGSLLALRRRHAC